MADNNSDTILLEGIQAQLETLQKARDERKKNKKLRKKVEKGGLTDNDIVRAQESNKLDEFRNLANSGVSSLSLMKKVEQLYPDNVLRLSLWLTGHMAKPDFANAKNKGLINGVVVVLLRGLSWNDWVNRDNAAKYLSKENDESVERDDIDPNFAERRSEPGKGSTYLTTSLYRRIKFPRAIWNPWCRSVQLCDSDILYVPKNIHIFAASESMKFVSSEVRTSSVSSVKESSSETSSAAGKRERFDVSESDLPSKQSRIETSMSYSHTTSGSFPLMRNIDNSLMDSDRPGKSEGADEAGEERAENELSTSAILMMQQAYSLCMRAEELLPNRFPSISKEHYGDSKAASFALSARVDALVAALQERRKKELSEGVPKLQDGAPSIVNTSPHTLNESHSGPPSDASAVGLEEEEKGDKKRRRLPRKRDIIVDIDDGSSEPSIELDDETLLKELREFESANSADSAGRALVLDPPRIAGHSVLESSSCPLMPFAPPGYILTRTAHADFHKKFRVSGEGAAAVLVPVVTDSWGHLSGDSAAAPAADSNEIDIDSEASSRKEPELCPLLGASCAGALPRLQYACSSTFERLQELQLESEEAETLGGDTMYHRLLAVDCEMCLVQGGRSQLARVAAVEGAAEETVLDELVIPEEPILDYLTMYSGMTKKTLSKAKLDMTAVQDRLADLLDGIDLCVDEKTILDTKKNKNSGDNAGISPTFIRPRMVVGHSVDNDLRACRIIHSRVLDTSLIFLHPAGLPYRHSLRFLTRTRLGRDIQNALGMELGVGHDSVEDALAALHLVQQALEDFSAAAARAVLQDSLRISEESKNANLEEEAVSEGEGAVSHSQLPKGRGIEGAIVEAEAEAAPIIPLDPSTLPPNQTALSRGLLLVSDPKSKSKAKSNVSSSKYLRKPDKKHFLLTTGNLESENRDFSRFFCLPTRDYRVPASVEPVSSSSSLDLSVSSTLRFLSSSEGESSTFTTTNSTFAFTSSTSTSTDATTGATTSTTTSTNSSTTDSVQTTTVMTDSVVQPSVKFANAISQSRSGNNAPRGNPQHVGPRPPLQHAVMALLAKEPDPAAIPSLSVIGSPSFVSTHLTRAASGINKHRASEVLDACSKEARKAVERRARAGGLPANSFYSAVEIFVPTMETSGSPDLEALDRLMTNFARTLPPNTAVLTVSQASKLMYGTRYHPARGNNGTANKLMNENARISEEDAQRAVEAQYGVAFFSITPGVPPYHKGMAM